MLYIRMFPPLKVERAFYPKRLTQSLLWICFTELPQSPSLYKDPQCLISWPGTLHTAVSASGACFIAIGSGNMAIESPVALHRVLCSLLLGYCCKTPSPRQFREERVCFGVLFQRDKSSSWRADMSASGKHSFRSRKLKAHIFKHMHTVEGENWKWLRLKTYLSDVLLPERLHYLNIPKQCH